MNGSLIALVVAIIKERHSEDGLVVGAFGRLFSWSKTIILSGDFLFREKPEVIWRATTPLAHFVGSQLYSFMAVSLDMASDILAESRTNWRLLGPTAL